MPQSASRSQLSTTSFYAQDQIDIGIVQLVAGVRYDRFGLDTVNRITGFAGARVDEKWSPRFGVILTETDEIAAINYVERVREAGPRSMPRGGENLRFSFGWASPKPGEPADAVVRRADSRLVAELLG